MADDAATILCWRKMGRGVGGWAGLMLSGAPAPSESDSKHPFFPFLHLPLLQMTPGKQSSCTHRGLADACQGQEEANV